MAKAYCTLEYDLYLTYTLYYCTTVDSFSCGLLLNVKILTLNFFVLLFSSNRLIILFFYIHSFSSCPKMNRPVDSNTKKRTIILFLQRKMYSVSREAAVA